jgi:hypothetical protein
MHDASLAAAVSTYRTNNSTNFDHRMKLYSAAAIAAGVSLLALAPTAEGEVIVTRKEIPIPYSYYGGTQHLVPLDINGDGINDFSFSLYSFAYHSFDEILRTWPLEAGGGVMANLGKRGFSYGLALPWGAKIGPSAHFSSDRGVVIEQARGFDFSSRYGRTLYGHWGGNPPNRYLGVRFIINGETHYGWIRLKIVTEPRGLTAEIISYAYETEPDKKLQAGTYEKVASTEGGQVSGPSLGMLAMGADGLSMWRREEAQQ